jgi:hypothetical protein
MPDEPSLREKAREAISNGGLPRQRPNRMFGGAGTGGPCALCGESIPQTGAEIEIEFNRMAPRLGWTGTVCIIAASRRGNPSA